MSTDPLGVAEAMMKERRDAVKSLAKLGDEKATLQAKITEVEKQQADAYELALTAGWSQSELKKMGFTRKNGPRRSKQAKDNAATIAPVYGQEVSA